VGTFIEAPLTTGGYAYPFRIACSFEGKQGHVVPDQLRMVDRERLGKRLCALPESTLQEVVAMLQEMFAA